MSWAPARSVIEPCPECGVPRPRRPEEVTRSDDPTRRLTTLVSMTRELLDADLALLTEIDGDRERACAAAGDWPELGPTLVGASLPMSDTYCALMLEGTIPHVVGDTRADERTRDVALTRHFGAGAYLGVPITLADAELYVLCCLAREARPHIGTRELRLLSGLAESVRAELEALSPAPARAD